MDILVRPSEFWRELELEKVGFVPARLQKMELSHTYEGFVAGSFEIQVPVHKEYNGLFRLADI